MDHLECLRVVFERFRQNNLWLKPKKCQLFKDHVVLLEHLVIEAGIEMNPALVHDVLECKPP